MNPEAGCNMTKVFDPILAGSEEDEYHFKPHKLVKDYLETHFRRCLSKKERKAMLKADPKPDCEATTTPEVDDFLQTFWKGTTKWSCPSLWTVVPIDRSRNGERI